MPFSFDNTYQYNGEHAKELVLTPATERPALTDIFGIEEGIKGKKYVHTLGRASKLTKKDAGCGTGKQQLTLSTTAKMWDPQDAKMWLYECWADMRGKVLEWKLKNGNDKNDITDTDIEDYLIDVAQNAAYEDMLRFAWFGKKNITAAELTGAAGDVANYNLIDGFWTKTFAAVAAGKTKRVAISDNGEATVAAQALEPGDAFPIFQNLFNSAPQKLKNAPLAGRQFMVTDTLFTEYMNYRESQNLDTSFTIQESGVTSLRYRGVPITVINEWDQHIQSDFLVGGKYDLPHRAVLTQRNNLKLGFDSMPGNSASEIAFKIWFSDDDELWNARLLYMLDYQTAEDDMLVVAY